MKSIANQTIASSHEDLHGEHATKERLWSTFGMDLADERHSISSTELANSWPAIFPEDINELPDHVIIN